MARILGKEVSFLGEKQLRIEKGLNIMNLREQDWIDSGAPEELKGKEFLEKTLVLTLKKQNENSNNYCLFSAAEI